MARVSTIVETHASPALKALWAEQIAAMTPAERKTLLESLKQVRDLQDQILGPHQGFSDPR